MFDIDRAMYEISGRAMLEGMINVHNRVLAWIENSLDKIEGNICINFKLSYADSRASKMISMLMSKLENYYTSGMSIEIRWYYNISDDDIYNLGEMLTKTKKLPIKMIGIVNNKQQ